MFTCRNRIPQSPGSRGLFNALFLGLLLGLAACGGGGGGDGVPTVGQAYPSKLYPFPKFAFGYGPQSVALGDVNGDSVLDLAVANGASNDVPVLLGNGDGTFQVQQRFAAGEFPLSVALGDVNGDSVLDLVTNDVSVLLGNGDGTFQAQQRFAAGFFPSSVTLGDINGDRVLDLAVTNPFTDGVSVLLGNGDGR